MEAIGGSLRFTIDTEPERSIVPDTFFNQLDKVNAVLEANGAGGKKIDYVEYVNAAIEKHKRTHSFANPIQSPSRNNMATRVSEQEKEKLWRLCQACQSMKNVASNRKRSPDTDSRHVHEYESAVRAAGYVINGGSVFVANKSVT